MNRIKRCTEQVFLENKAKFGLDFARNKKVLEEITIVRSKELKNEIAGFITRTLRKEKHDAEERRLRANVDLAQEEESKKSPKVKSGTEFKGATLEEDTSG